MRTIHKYQLGARDYQYVNMPKGATITTAQIQNGDLCLWAMVDTEEAMAWRCIRVISTGHEIGESEELAYIGTVQMAGGALVFHVFELFE